MRFFRYFVHKVVPIQNACVQKTGVTQPKIYGIGSKVNQFIYTLVCKKVKVSHSLIAVGAVGVRVQL